MARQLTAAPQKVPRSKGGATPLLQPLHRRRAALRRSLGPLALLALLLCLLAAAFTQAARLPALFPGWSARYRSPISTSQAENARRYAIDSPESGLWPTFWQEYAALTMKSELADITARCLMYSGQGYLARPTRFASGGWPGATDNTGCVVSQALAWRLWGSYDVLGMQLSINGSTYTVRGVFEGDDLLCIAQTTDEGSPQGWQGVELGPNITPDRAGAEGLLTACGLGLPDTLVSGGAINLFAALLCWLPIALAGLCLLAHLLWLLLRASPVATRWGLLGAAVLLALLLPSLLQLLPAWLLPAKWSDAAHWSGLFAQLGAIADEFLGMWPAWRDLPGKKALCLCAGAGLLATPIACGLAARLAKRQKRRWLAHRLTTGKSHEEKKQNPPES